jgi:protein SSD1
MLQQQQQQIAATHQQYVNMGMIPQQQQLPNQYQQLQGQMQNLNLATPAAFQFPQQSQMGQQHLGIPLAGGMAQPAGHRRNQSAMPNMGMGPPPAPSSGAAGAAFNDFGNFGQARNENSAPSRGRGGGAAGGGHARRHSLALPEAKKAAELAEAKRKTSGFQFPIPGAGGASPSTSNRSSSPNNAENPQAPAPLAPTSGARGAFNGRGHGRSQSMAVGSGRGMAQSSRGGPQGFQFPPPQATNDGGSTSDLGRRNSQGHGRTSSRNFEGNWRNPNPNNASGDQQQSNMGSFQMNQQATAQPFQPSHRQRQSFSNQSISSMQNFQYSQQPQLVQLPQGQVLVQNPNIYGGQPLNALQLAQLQAYQQAGIQPPSLAQLTGQHNGPQLPQQQQQRKTLFTPYLPQATLPALLGDGQLVAGTLRVNKKNRSDAYVTTLDLDADIFICGSKDRNRALEGDYVAVELLDVDEVWGQKREKEEKKKRKDVTDQRSGSNTAVNDATTQPESAQDGGIRRRGSLKQRPTQKKNDDVEVEGQSLLLMEEDEINDEQKPLYAGHIVAVIERTAGQMFSGTLGLLRPSSQATKEKQEAERQAREGGNASRQPERQQDRPKIVWFKPTDKRVPLIAIPTEQAPKDFVDKHQSYADQIFVACIKRWPITSLHPFGTLAEQLGTAGELKVETDALLRDNNFGPDDFSDAVIKNIGFEEWSVANDGEDALEGRRDFREEETFTIDPNGSKELDDAIHFKDLGDGHVEVGIHVADVSHFIKANSLVDREAKKRGTGVYLMNRTVNMLPPKLSQDIICLLPGEERYAISVVFKINAATGRVIDEDTWIGKSVIKSSGKLSYEEVDAVISGETVKSLDEQRTKQILLLHDIAQKLRRSRYASDEPEIPSLRLLYSLDDENVPVEHNIFDSSPSHEMIEELSHKTNAVVAEKLYAGLKERALLRTQKFPKARRLRTFAERMTNLGYDIDISNSAALQNSLFRIEDPEIRKGMETLVFKAMVRAKYEIPARADTPDNLGHFALNLPLYTHFTNPSRRYADIVVHRQLESVLSEGAVEFTDDVESLHKVAETCNGKKDSAHNAQEQSVHIESCRRMNRLSAEQGGDLISVGIVVCVYESAFDVLIPEYGFEKRVHCDQLPLKKAEFDKNKRLLELYWEKSVPSSTFIPEDERPQAKGHRPTNSTVAREVAAKQRQAEEAERKAMQTGSIDANDVDALFDDDDDASEVTDNAAGVALNGDRATQSGPPSPARNGHTPQRSKSDSRLLNNAAGPEAKLSNKDKYLGLFTLREENGNYIQDVKEMTRVPVLLKTDLTKSPPYVFFLNQLFEPVN